MQSSLQQIQSFLAARRIAVIGVSRDSKDFTRKMFRELIDKGYDAIPVKPDVAEIDGITCYSSIAEVPEPVEGVLVMTAPAVTEQVTRECVAAGVRRVWMYRATGQGAVSPQAVALCHEKGVEVVEGECPFMFLQDTAWPHRVHGFCRKILGRFPK